MHDRNVGPLCRAAGMFLNTTVTSWRGNQWVLHAPLSPEPVSGVLMQGRASIVHRVKALTDAGYLLPTLLRCVRSRTEQPACQARRRYLPTTCCHSCHLRQPSAWPVSNAGGDGCY
jgi:hypothetical protein